MPVCMHRHVGMHVRTHAFMCTCLCMCVCVIVSVLVFLSASLSVSARVRLCVCVRMCICGCPSMLSCTVTLVELMSMEALCSVVCCGFRRMARRSRQRRGTIGSSHDSTSAVMAGL